MKRVPRKTVASASDQIPVENALARIRVALPSMAKRARKIAEYVIQHPKKVIGMSVTELAEATDSSDGSVINFCQGLGLSGFQQLKLSLAQDLVQPVQFIQQYLDRREE